ncbi:N-terminal EF-hand calcium-binding protein 3 isoform X1 [Ahaetulla prasina]|uniref:N-terminal EF-hand calcium-binding protein 3 isoform X1 n=1 Tax=Ahaetulla prasina TaxID=499056 RepID=UPI002647A9BE|nr:N-terminal EF-hand calcium-binding protein 3 isoform X1 [Ahaetulla prasina]
MMACTEMLTMCLLSAKHAYHMKATEIPQHYEKGLAIFHDIFRRADKNDDGKLSFEEFKKCCADGILNSEELWKLFNDIDRHHSGNLETEKLCDYFTEHLGEYRHVLSALEQLNIAVLSAMDKTKLAYESSSKMEQFVTRFLLRETMNQIQSLQVSLECAADTIEEQSGRERNNMNKSEALIGQHSTKRCGRRIQKNICYSPTDPYSGMLTTGVCVETDSQWPSEITQLQQLIGKLECKNPRLEPLKHNMVCKGTDSHILVAQRQISVAESGLVAFCQILQTYTETTAGHSSCLHVSAHKLASDTSFILYELWQDVVSWRSHLQSDNSKKFQHAITDLLDAPELLTTMLFPASWWIMNNN